MYRSRSLVAFGFNFTKSGAFLVPASLSIARKYGSSSIQRLGFNNFLQTSICGQKPLDPQLDHAYNSFRMSSTESQIVQKATKLYIGNLGWDTSNEDLQECFSRFGEPTECYIVFDRNTGESRGFGFVTYPTEEEAIEAVSSMDGVELDGRKIKVMISKPREALDFNDSVECKVYVGNLSSETNTEQIEEMFSSCGTVSDVKLITDRDTGASRGFAFVTYSTPEEANKAIESMNNKEVDGRVLRVNISRPRNMRDFSDKGSRYENTEESKIFVGNLGWDTTSDDLHRIFSDYGRILDARVITDRETGNSRGFGFVTFESSSSVEKAVAALDGMEMGGREIRVNLSTPKKPRFQESYDEEW